jgi:hypothetical protein
MAQVVVQLRVRYQISNGAGGGGGDADWLGVTLGTAATEAKEEPQGNAKKVRMRGE